LKSIFIYKSRDSNFLFLKSIKEEKGSASLAKPTKMSTEKKISNEPRKLTPVPIPKENEKENYSLSVNETLYSLFDKAIQSQYADMSEAAVVITPSKVADYQCNSAMAISQVDLCYMTEKIVL
jgi:hypothetical protein